MSAPIFDEAWEAVISRRKPAARAAELATITGTHGIDTSDHQPSVTWGAVAAAGYGYALVKASEGASRSYPTTDAQWNGAIGAGLVCGLYHFADPAVAPEVNADSFAQQVNRLGATAGHLPPALDLELGSGDMSGWCQAFIARLRQQIGYQRVMVYSNASFFSASIGETWMDDDVVLWIADYSAAPGRPRYLTPRVAIHQYSKAAVVPGVAGAVDLNFAIQPLAQIIDGSNDLTPEESSMLTDIHNALPTIQSVFDYLNWMYGQFAGLGPDGKPAPFPQVPGWPPLEGGTNRPLSLLDFSREANVQLNALTSAIQSVLATVQAIQPARPSDPQVLAHQIVSEFAAALKSDVQPPA